MSCLFGYCGASAPELLERMVALLAHRCPVGWERGRGKIANGDLVEVGHGIAAWNQPSQLTQSGDDLLGYSGVLFHSGMLAKADPLHSVDTLLSRLRSSATTPLLTQLTGSFVLALSQGDTFYLVRDPTGVKAIYWTVHHGRLLFASEIKALFADPTLPRQMRVGALPEYFSFSFIPSTRTMFNDIEELQPGSILYFRNGQAWTQRHFYFEEREADILPASHNHTDAVRDALEQSVAESLAVQPDKLPAVFLSGGIDSSAVLAAACRQLPEVKIPTFSVHFGAEYMRENEFIQLMVDRYRTDHHWLEIRPAHFLKQMRDIIWRLDDPIGDPVTVPNYLLAQAASEVADVVLNGEGGDPCFGGPKNIPMLLARLYGPLPEESHRGWLERNYLHSFQRGYQDLAELLNPDLLQESGGTEALVSLLEPFFQASRPQDFINKLMSMNIRLKGANLILVKVEKMSAANGVLALAPLFSRRIVETSLRCPPAEKLAGSVEKNVLKNAVRDWIPQEIIARPKSGMMVPVRFWFQGEMRRYAKKMLSRKQIQRHGLFNPNYVERLLNYEVEGVPSLRHGLKLWMLVTFLLWYEQMVEMPLPEPPVPKLRT